MCFRSSTLSEHTRTHTHSRPMPACEIQQSSSIPHGDLEVSSRACYQEAIFCVVCVKFRTWQRAELCAIQSRDTAQPNNGARSWAVDGSLLYAYSFVCQWLYPQRQKCLCVKSVYRHLTAGCLLIVSTESELIDYREKPSSNSSS